MNTIEELESQPDLLSEHLLTVIQDAKTKIRQFAASLIEPDVNRDSTFLFLVTRSFIFFRT